MIYKYNNTYEHNFAVLTLILSSSIFSFEDVLRFEYLDKIIVIS